MPDNTLIDFQSAPVKPQGMPTAELGSQEKITQDDVTVFPASHGEDIDPALIPTEEEMLTLRKVAAPLP